MHAFKFNLITLSLLAMVLYGCVQQSEEDLLQRRVEELRQAIDGMHLPVDQPADDAFWKNRKIVSVALDDPVLLREIVRHLDDDRPTGTMRQISLPQIPDGQKEPVGYRQYERKDSLPGTSIGSELWAWIEIRIARIDGSRMRPRLGEWASREGLLAGMEEFNYDLNAMREDFISRHPDYYKD